MRFSTIKDIVLSARKWYRRCNAENTPKLERALYTAGDKRMTRQWLNAYRPIRGKIYGKVLRKVSRALPSALLWLECKGVPDRCEKAYLLRCHNEGSIMRTHFLWAYRLSCAVENLVIAPRYPYFFKDRRVKSKRTSAVQVKRRQFIRLPDPHVSSSFNVPERPMKAFILNQPRSRECAFQDISYLNR